VTVAPVDSPRSIPAGDLQQIAEDEIPGTPIEIAESLPEALEEARGWAMRAEGRAVLVVGSVLLAGEAIAFARSEGWGAA